jgi:alpha-L-rhamnosidase
MLYDLRCEYLLNPLGIETPQPRLSWKVETTARGWRQMAYQVLVASSPELLATGVADVWDSGRVDSAQSIHIPYAGPALTSRQRCYWTVRVWGPEALEAAAAPACWEMGLLHPEDWRAEWIGAGWEVDPDTSSPCVQLRRDFSARGPIVSARVYATALGLYELWLNGQRVGEDLLTPGWTDYKDRVQYQSYDVTALVRVGENTIGGTLGDGWYSGYFFWERSRSLYGFPSRFCAQLELRYADGETEVITTDGRWRTAIGPILTSEIYAGECYDARRELPAWNVPGFADAAWAPARIFPSPAIAINAHTAPPVRRTEEITPQTLHDMAPGTTIFDLGQNMVGWARLAVPAGVSAGTTLTLRFAEMLNPDGTLYITNLRSARATDTYTSAGRDGECFEPHFTFHGFRYVEVSGLPVPATPATITGVVIHSDTPPTGVFSCSDPLLNQLQHNIQWGQRSNFLEVPTDCPQRDERLGWTGDAQVFIRTAAFNMDVAAFFTKWTRDLRDAQITSGTFPMVVPDVIGTKIGNGDGDGGAAWSDAGIICPWTIYRCYGDTRILAEHYPAMARYLTYLYRVNHRARAGFGDWLNLDDPTPKDVISVAYTIYVTRLMIEVATVLGKEADADDYRRRYAEFLAVFQQEFITPHGRVVGDSQTAYVLALAFDLTPEALRARTAGYLAERLHEHMDHLTTGFVGTPYLLHALTRTGQLELAYTLLLQQTYPSWLFPVTQGATTIWERWDSWHPERGFQTPDMNSFNHYAYGAVGEWLYQSVAGIDLDASAPAYQRMRIRPRPGGGLQWAKGSLVSLYGAIATHWTLEADTFTLTVTIPANTSATVILPTNHPAAVREGDRLVQDVPEISSAGIIDGCAAFTVGSGRYEFKVALGTH